MSEIIKIIDERETKKPKKTKTGKNKWWNGETVEVSSNLKLPKTSKILHLLNQALSSTFSRWPNHYILPWSNHSLLPFRISLVLSSSAEILSSSLTLHIHLNVFASVLSSLLLLSSLTCQVPLPYNITLCSHAEYNLLFAPKGKPLLL